MIEKTRDIYGLHSLYYWVNGQSVVFAPEMKDFLAMDGFRAEIDSDSLRFYLGYGFCPDKRTILRDVFKLLPAESVVVEDGSVRHKKYWTPLLCEEEPSDIDYWIDAVWNELQRATKLQDEEDIVGIALSGGLDSSLVASALRHANKEHKLIGFTLDYGDGAMAELEASQRVADFLDIDLRVVSINMDEVFNNLEQLQWIYDEPMIKFTFIPTYYLVQESSKHVKSLFTGDGGDELFIGYRKDYWQDPLPIAVFSKLGVLRKPMLKVGRSICNPIANVTQSRIFSLASEFFAREDASRPEWQYRVASREFQPYFSDEELKKLLCGDTKLTDSTVVAIDEVIGRSHVEQLAHVMTAGELPVDLLRLEKSAMQTSIKIKSPLLVRAMSDLALSIPISLRYQKGVTKYFLRELVKKYGLLPLEIAENKRKVGLTAPIYKWLSNKSSGVYFKDLVDSAVDVLAISREHAMRYFPPRTYTQTLKAWNLVGMSLWVKVFMKR